MFDAVFLSPHLDDVALSCGGHIWQLGELGRRVLVLTLMAGDPPETGLSEFALELHQRWEVTAGNAAAARRAEDKVACDRLKCAFQHWPFVDAVYRSDADGVALYPTWPDVIGELHAVDAAIVKQIVTRLARLPSFSQLYAPLSLGNHVDHQLVRLAAEEFKGQELLYYEDFPYVLQPGAMSSMQADAGKWVSDVVPISTAALQAKYDAIWAYTSQRSTFFRDRADLERVVGEFVHSVGGERYWRNSILS